MYMKTDTIKAIFTNLLFVIGVGLIIFGFIRGALTISRLVVFDKYPLQQYEEQRCEYEAMPYIPVDGEKEGMVSGPQEDAQTRKEKCLESVEHQRDVRKIEDIVTAITTLVAGSVLVFTFRRFIFK